ncbi:MAG: bifunctional glycosyltransferase family 2/GtrA family protein [Patescibacteria group bacterium]|nr:bifunctional glycosyltransferase family 2/GtrA family protein [Patescibacteria group bacterium]
MKTLSVLIPCYNEEHTIAQVLARVEAAPVPGGWQKELVIVDDGSTDGTRAILARSAHKVILRAENGGKGAAVKDALRAATGEYCIIQDADLEYDPKDYVALINALDDAHPVVFGSRLMGHNPYFSRVYVLGSKVITAFFNLLFGTHVSDLTTCYKLFPRALAPAIMRHNADGFVFDAVYLSYELAQGGAIREVPITYHPRTRSEGKKVSALDGVRCLVAMVELKFGQLARFLFVGGGAFVINLCVLWLLAGALHMYYLVAAGLSFCAAFAFNFLLQKFWTFKTHLRHAAKEMPAFLVMQLIINLGLNTVFLYVLVHYVHVHYLAAQAALSIIFAVVTYGISKHAIFTARA